MPDKFFYDAINEASALDGLTSSDQISVAQTLATKKLSGDKVITLVDTVSDLKSVENVGGTIVTKGYYSAWDGGGNIYYWDASSTDTDDGGKYIIPTFAGFSGTGRWIGNFAGGIVDVRKYGITGGSGNATSNSNQLDNALTEFDIIEFPDGQFYFDAIHTQTVPRIGEVFDYCIDIDSNKTIRGQGRQKTFLRTVNATDTIISSSTKALSRVEIKGMSLRGASEQYERSCGIWLGHETQQGSSGATEQNVFRCNFEEISCANFGMNGIRIPNEFANTFRGMYMNANWGHQMVISGETGTNIIGGYIEDMLTPNRAGLRMYIGGAVVGLDISSGDVTDTSYPVWVGNRTTGTEPEQTNLGFRKNRSSFYGCNLEKWITAGVFVSGNSCNPTFVNCQIRQDDNTLVNGNILLGESLSSSISATFINCDINYAVSKGNGADCSIYRDGNIISVGQSLTMYSSSWDRVTTCANINGLSDQDNATGFLETSNLFGTGKVGGNQLFTMRSQNRSDDFGGNGAQGQDIVTSKLLKDQSISSSLDLFSVSGDNVSSYPAIGVFEVTMLISGQGSSEGSLVDKQRLFVSALANTSNDRDFQSASVYSQSFTNSGSGTPSVAYSINWDTNSNEYTISATVTRAFLPSTVDVLTIKVDGQFWQENRNRVFTWLL